MRFLYTEEPSGIRVNLDKRVILPSDSYSHGYHPLFDRRNCILDGCKTRARAETGVNVERQYKKGDDTVACSRSVKKKVSV